MQNQNNSYSLGYSYCPDCGAPLSIWDCQGKIGDQTFYKCPGCGQMCCAEEEEEV